MYLNYESYQYSFGKMVVIGRSDYDLNPYLDDLSLPFLSRPSSPTSCCFPCFCFAVLILLKQKKNVKELTAKISGQLCSYTPETCKELHVNKVDLIQVRDRKIELYI